MNALLFSSSPTSGVRILGIREKSTCPDTWQSVHQTLPLTGSIKGDCQLGFGFLFGGALYRDSTHVCMKNALTNGGTSISPAPAAAASGRAFGSTAGFAESSSV